MRSRTFVVCQRVQQAEREQGQIVVLGAVQRREDHVQEGPVGFGRAVRVQQQFLLLLVGDVDLFDLVRQGRRAGRFWKVVIAG